MTGNLTHLRRTSTNEYERTPKLEEIWNELYNQFIERYGLGEKFQDLIRLKQQWITQLADYIIQEDRSMLTEAEMTTADIEELMKDGEGISHDDSIILMEQNLGFKLNTKKLSVVDYYNYVDYFTKLSKQIKETDG